MNGIIVEQGNANVFNFEYVYIGLQQSNPLINCVLTGLYAKNTGYPGSELATLFVLWCKRNKIGNAGWQ